MSSISMEWLGGPIVLNLKQDDIMADFADGYLPATTDGPENPDEPASLNAPAILDAPTHPDGMKNSDAVSGDGIAA